MIMEFTGTDWDISEDEDIYAMGREDGRYMEINDADRASLYIMAHIARALLNGSTMAPAELAIALLADWETVNAPCDITDEQITEAADLGIRNAAFLARMQRARR